MTRLRHISLPRSGRTDLLLDLNRSLQRLNACLAKLRMHRQVRQLQSLKAEALAIEPTLNCTHIQQTMTR